MPSWRDSVSRSISWAACVAYAGLFFSIPVSNITLFILLACCLLTLNFSIVAESIKSSLPIQLLIAFYLLHTVGLLYSQNMDNGLFVLEKKMTLLVFPLLLFPAWQNLASDKRSTLPFRIGVITIGSSIVFLVLATINKFFYKDSLAFHRDYFASTPYVFYSIYFATGSLLLLNSCYNRWQNSKTRILVLLLLPAYSLSMLVLISSKTGILAYVTGLGYFLYKRLPSRRLFYTSVAGLILSSALLLVAYPTTLNRFLELNKNLAVVNEDLLTNPEEFTGLNLRLYFWKSSITQLWKDNRLITGIGTGDGQDYLNMVYAKHRLDKYGYTDFDAHSQWIMTLLQLGLLGVGLLAAIFLIGARLARRFRSIDFLFFAWIVFCFSLSESVLESNKGVVFFALLFSMFCAHDNKTSSHPG